MSLFTNNYEANYEGDNGGRSARRRSSARSRAALPPDNNRDQEQDIETFVDDREPDSAGSDADEQDANANPRSSRRRSTRERAPRESFLSLVSPRPSARRASTRTGTERRHPYVRRYAGTRLDSEAPKYAFTYRSGMTDEPQYMGMGMVRGTIATMPFSELRSAVAYMLEHPDPEGRRPTMLARPANFERFEELREVNGGRDILLHEILKEDDDVLTDLFLIAGRVDYQGARSRGAKPRVPAVLEGIIPSTSSSSSSSTLNGGDIRYERIRRPANYRPALTRPEYRPINAGSLVTLLANVASPADDAVVYTVQPARSVKGHLDGNPMVLQGVCDPYMDRWFARTANEAQRSGLPELAPYGVLRNELAGFRRAMCPVEATTVNHIVDRLRRDEPAAGIDPIDEETVENLLRSGFTRDDIDRVWGNGASAGNSGPVA